MRNPTNRFLSFIVCVLLCGCGEPNAPMLHLTIKQDNGTSSDSSFRVFRTGHITDWGDHGDDGAGVTQRVTIDKIAEDGVTLTVALIIDIPDSAAVESKKQIRVLYGRVATVFRLKDTTVIARLERNKEK